MFGIFADFFASIITILFPVFASYKALRTSDPAQLTPWLIYFVILSLFLLVESWTVFVVGWFPFYSWIRLFALSYLVLPQTQGAKLLYVNYVEPFITDHERQIEVFIGDIHEKGTRFGLGYLKQIIELVRQHVLGLAPTKDEPSSARATNSGTTTAATASAVAGSYAQSLLSRFAMPSARAQQPSTSDFYGLISGAFAAATTNTTSASPRTASGGSRSMSTSANHPNATTPKSFPPEITTQADKQSFLATQREKLTVLMRALDREQRDLDLAYGDSNSSHYDEREKMLEADIDRRMNRDHVAADEKLQRDHQEEEDEAGDGERGLLGTKMGKSRSENSFQTIERDELDENNGSNSNKKRNTAGGGGGVSGWSPGSWFTSIGGGGGSSSSRGDGGRNDGGRDDRDDRGDVVQEVLEAVQSMSSSIDRK